MCALRRPTAASRVSRIAEQRGVHQAFQWLHLHEQQIMQWQTEMVAVAAPPFGEKARGAWLLDRFREVGLSAVHVDEVGNALGLYPATGVSRDDAGPPRPCILLSAHIDTVFPLETPIHPTLEGLRLTAPGACDNGAGVVGLLAIAAALRHGAVEASCDLLFAGNVGEEGEGDLRGIRHLYQQSRSGSGSRIQSHVVLDGAGHELAVTAAVGSRRYQVVIEGSGGHSWSDAGRPNPIVAMSRAIARLDDLPAVDGARWNAGFISGGTSVNSIPQSVSGRFDLRSTDPDQLVRLEVDLYRAFEDAVTAANAVASSQPSANGSARAGTESTVRSDGRRSDGRQNNGPQNNAKKDDLRLHIEKIGDRPAGQLARDAAILEALCAVDRHLGIRTGERVASTDANIPLSLGLEAISIGAGGEGGGAHTSKEWYDARNRELALRRILLLVLALADAA